MGESRKFAENREKAWKGYLNNIGTYFQLCNL